MLEVVFSDSDAGAMLVACHVRNSVRTEGQFCCDVGLRQAPA